MHIKGLPGGSEVKESACVVGDLGSEDLLEMAMITHWRILAWRIPVYGVTRSWRGSMDCSPPGSSVHEILQARTPVWVAISFLQIIKSTTNLSTS